MAKDYSEVIEIAKQFEGQWRKSIALSALAHRGQLYGDNPYFYHLSEVESNVVGLFAKGNYCETEIDNLRAIAMLHDTLEDTCLTAENMREAGINEDVILAVECITKREGQPYLVYLDVVLSNELARKVKLCDTMANLSNSIKEMNMKRIRKYTKQVTLLEEGF